MPPTESIQQNQSIPFFGFALTLGIIEKNSGKFRVICIPSVQDRLVQRLILRHLTLNKDHLRVLTGISFGVSKGKDQGVHAAINEAIKKRNQYPWVLKTDIAQFFDNIPRDFLKAKIRTRACPVLIESKPGSKPLFAHVIYPITGTHLSVTCSRVKAKSLLPLLFSVVDTEVKPRNRSHADEIKDSGITRGRGLRQGMPLSPLLSNLVLSDFDRRIQKKLRVLRYADDIICFCKSEVECIETKNYIEGELKKLELSIPSLDETNSKTTIHVPQNSVIFLGVEIYPQGEKYNKKIPKKTREKAIQKIKDLSSVKANLANDYTFSSVVKRLQDIPTGYKSAFPKCTNLSSLENLLQEEAQKTKAILLQNIFGENIMNSLSEEKRKFLGF